MENRKLQLEDGRCTFCRQVAENVCGRCGDYYCSIQCQTNDWRSHKYVCISMPCLVPATLKFGFAQPVINSALFDLNVLQHTAAELMPKMQKPQHILHKQSQKIVQIPRSNSRIIIAGYRSANRFSIIDFKDKTENIDNFKKIDLFGKTASPLQAIPKPLTYAIAQLEGHFRRVQVLSVSEDGKIKVCFYDIGFSSKRNLSELREISNEIKQLQQYCVEVVLRNVKGFVVTEKLKTFLSSLRNKEYKLCYEQDSGVDLFDLNSSKSLNEEIARIGADSETYSNNNIVETHAKQNVQPDIIVNGKEQFKNKVIRSQAPAPATSEMEMDSNFSSVTETKKKQTKRVRKENVQPNIPFQMCTLAVGQKNEEVIVVDNSSLDKGYIGVIPPNALHNVAEVQEYLNAYIDTHQPYKPKLLEYCIAKFDGHWYRAKVLDITDDTKFSVIYIDFSNVGVLEVDDIRRYPSDLKFDCMTNLCFIDGFPQKLTEKQLEFLENEMPVQGKLIIDKIIECEEDVVTIQCTSIIQKLRTIKI